MGLLIGNNCYESLFQEQRSYYLSISLVLEINIIFLFDVNRILHNLILNNYLLTYDNFDYIIFFIYIYYTHNVRDIFLGQIKMVAFWGAIMFSENVVYFPFSRYFESDFFDLKICLSI